MGLLDQLRLKQAQRKAAEAAQRGAGLLSYQAARDSAEMGAVGASGGLLSDTTNPYKSYGDAAVMGALMAPGVGDVVGPLYDAQMFYRHPETRTPTNFGLAALGLLPAVPSLGYLMSRGGNARRGAGKIGRQQGIVGGPTGAATMARAGNDAPQQALGLAEQMEALGHTRDEIWSATADMGYPVFRGPDGKLRFEIDDSAVMLRDWEESGFASSDNVSGRSGDTVGQSIEHDALYDGYPSHRDIGYQGSYEYGPSDGFWRDHNTGEVIQGSGGGMYEPVSNRIQATGQGYSREAALTGVKSSSLHELQHATQEAEGFARGGSPEIFNQQGDARLARDAMSWRKELARYPDADDFAADGRVYQDYLEMGAEDWVPSREARDLALDKANNPDAQLEELIKFYRLDQRASDSSPMELYQHLAGEAEARAVQARMNMTPAERAANPFYADYDVPEADQIVRYGDGVAASVPDLPMDEASRMQRARDMGFDTDKTWYHGTPGEITDMEFVVGHGGGASEAIGRGSLGEYGVYFIDNKKSAQYFGDNVVEAALPSNMKRVDATKELNEWASEMGYKDAQEMVDDYYGGSMADALDVDSFAAQAAQDAKKEGYKGVIIDTGGLSTSDNASGSMAIVFDPKNIRSKFAKFDPAKKDSANILAGLAGGGLLGGSGLRYGESLYDPEYDEI